MYWQVATNERSFPMEPKMEGNALERGLHVLERQNDPELAEAYKRYMQRLEELVGRDKMDTYALIYQRDRRQSQQQVIGAALTTEERAIQDTVAADPQVHALYEQYLSLARARGLLDPKFDNSQAPAE
jgi:hypothetical protein